MMFIFGFFAGKTIGTADPAALLPLAYAVLAIGLVTLAGLALSIWILRRKRGS